ncbi:MAG: Serine protease [Patescibacteria group bacterium]|nr:Serine protease [Patescibacteria group bacterium]
MAKIKRKSPSRSKLSAKPKSGERKLPTLSPPAVKAHHAKAYRKRHYGLLGISLLSAALLLFTLTSNRIANSNASKSAKNLISDLFNTSSQTSSNRASVSSTHGFSLQYDTQTLYASAVDSVTGELFIGEELTTNRGYTSIRLGQTLSSKSSTVEPGSINIQYYPTKKATEFKGLSQIERDLIAPSNKNFTIQSSETTQLAGQPFLMSNWQSKPQTGVASNFNAKFISYSGLINGSPMTITLNQGLTADSASSAPLNEVLNSLTFSEPEESSQVSSLAPANHDLSIFDRLTFTSPASAATVPPPPSSSEKISTYYGPAVVKIYNIFCMDISRSGQTYLQNICKGATGSGFMVGGGGYIATNGHVAVNNPLELVIENAFSKYDEGDLSYFNDLVRESGLNESDLLGAKDDKEKITIMLDKFYSIPATTFLATNNVENLLVGLGEKQPDIEELISLTEARQKYPEQDTIKQAELKAQDYRAFDGISGGAFKSSDVALIKINGDKFPSVKLGNISSLTQGSGLSIIGFPGAAGTNGLVESTQSRATLTSGKVSSIKSASGSSNQLIETDATIGHGNSGGPAFNDAGEVVGIATYTIDGSGDGDGVFNYVRDVADLSSLASKSSLDLTSISPTQQSWEEGVNLFYQARYSKALKSFTKVKELYPEHPKVAQFTALAEQRIASGEEVKDFPFILVGAFLIGMVIVALVSVFLIIRHKKAHTIYNTQLAQPSTTSLAPSPPIPAPGVLLEASPLIPSTPPVSLPSQPNPTVPTPPVPPQEPPSL